MTSDRSSSRAPGTCASGWSSTWQAEPLPAETDQLVATSPRIPREELRELHRRYWESTDPAERDRIRAQLVDNYHDFVYFLARIPEPRRAARRHRAGRLP